MYCNIEMAFLFALLATLQLRQEREEGREVAAYCKSLQWQLNMLLNDTFNN